MSKITLAEQSVPATPSAGNGHVWPDTTTSRLCYTDDSGRSYALVGGGIINASVANQAPAAATDVYLTDSDLIVPNFGLQTRTLLHWVVSASKTAAGTATPIWVVRLGTNRTTADAAVLTITGPAQTANADTGVFEIWAVLRSIGAAGVLQGTIFVAHNASATTGFTNNVAGVVEGTSAGFDTTAASGKFFGLSLNTGASAAWTITQIQGRMEW